MKLFLLLILFTSQALAVTKIKLALNWKPEPQFGGFYAAQINGEFKKRNLDIEILEGGSGTPTVQMLANKTLPFAIVSADEIILSQDRNVKSKVIAIFATYQTAPYMIMSHKARGFKNIKQVFDSLEGNISIQSGLPFYIFLANKFGKPNVQVVPYLGGISHFLNNPKLSQQGYITSEPLLAKKAGVEVNSFLVADEGFNPYVTVLAINADYLKENPELVTQVVQAVRAGWKAYLKDPTPANLHMSKLNKSMDLETFKLSAEAQKSLIQNKETAKVGLGIMNKERWQTLIQQLTDLKLIKSPLQAGDLYKNLP
jgi:NitT/TauT family transport system substrate-binding protein